MKVVIIVGADWSGLWIDDTLVEQTHDITVDHVADHTQNREFTLQVIDADNALNDWLFDNGQFNDDDTVEQALARAVDYVPECDRDE